MKERVREQLDTSEKEMEEIRFAIVVMGRQSYIAEGEEIAKTVKLRRENWQELCSLRGVEWVYGLFLFPLVLGEM